MNQPSRRGCREPARRRKLRRTPGLRHREVLRVQQPEGTSQTHGGARHLRQLRGARSLSYASAQRPIPAHPWRDRRNACHTHASGSLLATLRTGTARTTTTPPAPRLASDDGCHRGDRALATGGRPRRAELLTSDYWLDKRCGIDISLNLHELIYPFPDKMGTQLGDALVNREQAIRLGRHIRRLRRASKLAASDLAPHVGVDASQILRLERGEVGAPQAALLTRIADYFQIPASDLFSLAGYPAAAGLPTSHARPPVRSSRLSTPHR